MTEDLPSLLGRLRGLLEERVGKNQARAILHNLLLLRQQGADDTALRAAAMQMAETFGRMPAATTGFSPSLCKAIAWSAPRRIGALAARVTFGKPARGLEEEEGRAVAHHADLLASAYGPGDEDIAEGVAWKNALLFRHHFVLGDIRGRNDPEPLEALARAWHRCGGGEHEAPALVVPGHGLVVARGGPLSPDVLAAWEPASFVFIPEDDAQRHLHLDQEEELRQFFRQVAPALHAGTVACLVHLALAPFSFVGVVQMDRALLARCEREEARLEEPRVASPPARMLLDEPTVEPAPLAEVSFLVEPGHTRVTLRPGGELEIC